MNNRKSEHQVIGRRQFLAQVGTLSLAAASAPAEAVALEISRAKNPTLRHHRIDRVEFITANFHWPRLVGKNARIGVHGQHKKARLVKLFTDQGATGWGLRSSSNREDSELKASITGKSVDELIIPDKGIREQVDPSFDLALHDLAGVILNQPVYRLMGAKGPKETVIYSGMIYFDELEPEESPSGLGKVLENCYWDYDYGYRQLKVKIGRSGRWYPHDVGLATDIHIVKVIWEEFGGRGVDILVDANDMYNLQDAKDFLSGVEGVPILWLEEPFIETIEEGRKLKDWMNRHGRGETFYADGERNPDHDVCRQLAREGMLDVYLSDIVGFGFTPWRKLMPFLLEHGTLASPHAWGSLLKTHYVSHIAAGLGNLVTIEGVTCISDEIDFGDYRIVDGKLRVSEQPGFGMKLV